MGNNNKLFRIILIVFLGLSGLLSILFYANVVNEGVMIYWCYLLLIIASLTTLVFSVLAMVKNPKNAKNALIGIVGLIVICIIGYALAGNEEFYNVNGELMADAATSRKSEAGLIAFYIMLVASIGTVIYAEVSKMLK